MVSRTTQAIVRKRANNLCEYCHSPEYLSPDLFTIDHILPQSLKGSDDLDNLALACRRCNERHYNFTTGIDPQTGEETCLFNPRKNQWSKHFIWTKNGLKIIGLTPIGRATCQRLDLNDEFHNNQFIQNSRKFWLQLGIHPPLDDLQL